MVIYRRDEIQRGRPGEQLELRPSRGGKRKGAGRKPKGARRGTPHLGRAGIDGRAPVHVTIRMRPGLPTLRSKNGHRAFVKAALGARERLGMRLVAWSLQRDHMHLLVEADSADALWRGMTGLETRFVRAFNARTKRTGPALADRYHARVLQHPREVRNALVYVFANARYHFGTAPARGPSWIDPWSSGPWFDGWGDAAALAAALRRELERVLIEERFDLSRGPPVAEPNVWLLTTGWRRHGLISSTEAPAS